MSEIKLLDQQLTIIDEDGNETLCQILFTFESKRFNKKYVLFYPLEEVEGNEEDIAVMAASYTEEEGGVGELHEIESDEEWELVEEVLEKYEDSLEDEDEDDDDEDGEDDEDEDDDDECDCDDEECECHHHHKE